MAKARSFNDRVHDEVVRHTIDVTRFGEGVREKVIANLEELSQDIESKLNAKASLFKPGPTPFTTQRLEVLLRTIRASIASQYKANDEVLRTELRELADVETLVAPKIVNKVFNGALAQGTLTRKDAEALADHSMIQGATSKDWWDKQSTNLQTRFATQVRLGFAQGEPIDDIVRRVIGTKTGRTRILQTSDGGTVKVPETAGGVMDISRRDATTLVRTAVQTVSNNVLNATYDENQDVLKGKQALATLDTRTSDICRARDGAAWDFEGKPLPESRVQIDFPGPPPWHMRCRTVLIPVTKSWEELTGIKGLTEPSDTTRASMNGQVAADLNYGDWLKTQPESVQRDVLGPGRHKLWKDGTSLADMVDQSGRSLTIQELRAKAGVTVTKVDPTPPKIMNGAELWQHIADHPGFTTMFKDLSDTNANLDRTHEDYKKADEQYFKLVDAPVSKQVDDQINAANKERYKLALARNQLQDRIEEIKRQLKTEIHKQVELPPEARLNPKLVTTTTNPEINRKAKVAQDFISRVAGKGVAKMETPVNETTPVNLARWPTHDPTRSFEFNHQLYMHRDASVSVHVHEWGHAWEETNPEANRLANEFLKKRAGNDPLKKLKDVTGNSNYADSEVTWEDKFWNPYIGKHYASGATEVTSMALEELHRDPVHLMQTDPELFETLINILRGTK